MPRLANIQEANAEQTLGPRTFARIHSVNAQQARKPKPLDSVPDGVTGASTFAT
jgi:hypothetical protein